MKKFLMLLCLMPAIMLAGCTDSPVISVPEAAQADPTAEPGSTLAPVPTPAPTPTSSTHVPEPTPTDDFSGALWLSDAEEGTILSFWPLTQYAPADMGSLTATQIMLSGGVHQLTMNFSSPETFSDLADMLTGYIQGDWANSSNSLLVSGGSADGQTLDCTLYENGDSRTIMLRFSPSTHSGELETMFAKHWPEEAISWPDALTENGSFVQTYITDANGVIIQRGWIINDCPDVLAWYDSRYRGTDGFNYAQDDDQDAQKLSFTAKGLDTTVAAMSGVLMVIFSGPPQPAEEAGTISSEGNYTTIVLNDGTLNIIDYNGPEGDLVIPAQIGGVAVTGVSSGFSGKAFTSVTVPEGVTFLGDYVFSDCAQLTAAELPSSLKRIGAYAFANNTALVSLSIPRSVAIDEEAFNNSEKFEGLTSP